MPELLTFRRFNDVVLAQNLVDLLIEHHIEYLLEKTPTLFNPTFGVRTEASDEYVVKINDSDFTKANQMLADYEAGFTNDVEADYYLFSFTDAELMEIVAKPDEWSAFDLSLAKKILDDKGLSLGEAAEQRLNDKRLDELKKPEKSETLWIYVGYFFAICGGILGFFFGWQLWKSKKTLPNGEQVYTYTNGDRESGKHIFYLSIGGLLMAIIYKVISLSN